MKPVHLLLIGGGALVAYFFYRKKQSADPAMPFSNPRSAQPSQMYPWQANQPARVDNKNQPWYNGDRSFMVGPVSDLQNAAMDLKAGASVIHSLGDIWGDMSDWFGGNNDKSNLIASSDDWAFDMDEMIMGGGGSDSWSYDDSLNEYNETAWA